MRNELDALVEDAKLKNKNPIKLTFNDLEYEVTVKYNRKDAKIHGKKTNELKIIKNASGYAMPG
jgi:LEA14-like dessication related protein